MLQEDLKRELLNIRHINETLKDNVKANSDKIVALQLEVSTQGKGDRPRQHGTGGAFGGGGGGGGSEG